MSASTGTRRESSSKRSMESGNTGAVRQREQMDHGVRRSAHRLFDEDRVVERARHRARVQGSDLPRPSRRCVAPTRSPCGRAPNRRRRSRTRRGRVKPSASATPIIVAAVPIVMQVPNERAIPTSISRQSSSSMRPGRVSRPNTSTRPSRSRARRRANCRAASDRPGHRSPDAGRDGAHQEAPAVVLSQPPSSTAPSIGWLRISSSVSIATGCGRASSTVS